MKLTQQWAEQAQERPSPLSAQRKQAKSNALYPVFNGLLRERAGSVSRKRNGLYNMT